MISPIHGYSNPEKYKKAAKLQKDVEDFLANKKALESFEAGNAGAAKLKQLAHKRKLEQYPLLTEYKIAYGRGYEKRLVDVLGDAVNVHHLRRVFQHKVTLNDEVWPVVRDAINQLLNELKRCN